MFDHPLIQTYAFEDIPLGQDLSLMDEIWMAKYEAALTTSVDGYGESAHLIGYHAPATATFIGDASTELNWYPNTHDRFHQVCITLPKFAFVTCVASWHYDYDPVIFVRSDWLTNLHLRSHSVFALIDAINVKKALACGLLTRSKLVSLRDKIDEIAASNPSVVFMSFADSLLLKINYSVGQYNSYIKYTYEPEKIIRLLESIRLAYQSTLGLGIYTIITQGINEYYDDTLLHISSTKNHISFNSLGLPFAQIQAIEHHARAALKAGVHPAADVYLDGAFYHSIRFKSEFIKNEEPKFPYTSPIIAENNYYFPMSLRRLTKNLK